jgi:hypothetical protein
MFRQWLPTICSPAKCSTVENALPKPDSSAHGQPAALWAGTAGLFLGWFVLDTLVVRAGPVRHSLKFYEMSALIADPPGVLFGIGAGHTLHSAFFGLLCAACALGPWAARRLPSVLPQMAHALPLALMLVCAALLYWRTAGDLLVTPERAAPITSDLWRLANDVLNRGAAVAARSVSAGAGAWLALASAVSIGWNGRRA